jgi:hypothetical protein
MLSDDVLKTVAARRNELTRWQTPKDFVAKVEELAGPIKSERLFNDPAALVGLGDVTPKRMRQRRPSMGRKTVQNPQVSHALTDEKAHR